MIRYKVCTSSDGHIVIITVWFRETKHFLIVEEFTRSLIYTLSSSALRVGKRIRKDTVEAYDYYETPDAAIREFLRDKKHLIRSYKRKILEEQRFAGNAAMILNWPILIDKLTETGESAMGNPIVLYAFLDGKIIDREEMIGGVKSTIL